MSKDSPKVVVESYRDKRALMGRATNAVVEAGVLMERTRNIVETVRGAGYIAVDVEETLRAAEMLEGAAAALRAIAGSTPPPAIESSGD